MDKFLVIVRHGDYAGSGDDPLSKFGIEQMQKLRKVLYDFVLEKAKAFGEERVVPIFFSFSDLKRAIESIQELRWVGRDIIITSEGDASRSHISEPRKIIDKVLGLTNYYGADVIIIVAHGDMPAVIAETARESATGEKLSKNLDMPGKGRGYIVNLSTGEVIPVGWDSLDEKKPSQPATRYVPEFVAPKPPPPPPLVDDDIPF
jgi:hypothetical protein